MRFGLSPLQGGGAFEQTIQECERAEAAGVDSIFLGEHHNHPVLYPTPLVGLAAIASRTHRIRLGTGVLLLPLYHPVAVAEKGAMVDMISGGRLILGVGAGYAPEEFAAFGLSVKQRGSRLNEASRPAAPPLDRGARQPSGSALLRDGRDGGAATGPAAATTDLVRGVG